MRSEACSVFNRALGQMQMEMEMEMEQMQMQMAASPPCLVREIAGKGVGMLAQRKLYPGDLIVAEKPVLTMPQAVFESDRESTIEWLDKSIDQLGIAETELLMSLTDNWSDPNDPDDLTYIGLFYTNCMAWEGDVVICPILATANHACRPNAQFLPRVDKGVTELRATYVIEPGEEVNISYLSMTEEGGERRSVRQMELWRGYGFHCNCQACTLVASEFDNEEELRENLKQLQMVGAKNWDEIDASEYLEGISRLQGNMKHIMDVLAICFHASKDQALRLEYGVRCLTLVLSIYGPGSPEAENWRERLEVLQLWRECSLLHHI